MTDSEKAEIMETLFSKTDDPLMVDDLNAATAYDDLMVMYVAINRYGNEIQRSLYDRDPEELFRKSDSVAKTMLRRLKCCRKIESFLKIVMDLIPLKNIKG